MERNGGCWDTISKTVMDSYSSCVVKLDSFILRSLSWYYSSVVGIVIVSIAAGKGSHGLSTIADNVLSRR